MGVVNSAVLACVLRITTKRSSTLWRKNASSEKILAMPMDPAGGRQNRRWSCGLDLEGESEQYANGSTVTEMLQC